QVTLKFMKEAARYNGLAVDPVTRRKLEIIKLASSLPPPDRDEGAKELAALTTRLDSSYATRAIPYGGRNLTRDEASEVARNLQDPAEMRILWEAERADSGASGSDYARSVELANEGARGLGFRDVGDMWRSSYDMPADDFAAVIDRLWMKIEPVYR